MRAFLDDAASLAWALGVLLGGALPAFLLAGLSEIGVDVPRMMGEFVDHESRVNLLRPYWPHLRLLFACLAQVGLVEAALVEAACVSPFPYETRKYTAKSWRWRLGYQVEPQERAR